MTADGGSHRHRPNLLARWLDALYPPLCEVCSTPLRNGRYLCPACHRKLPRIPKPFCIRCGLPIDGLVPDDILCADCRTTPRSFEFARAPLRARHEALDLVHAFKYGRQLHLHHELAGLMAELWDDPRLSTQLDPPWVLVPVPLHWKRQRWRRFNQSHELARTLARLMGLRCAPVLRRVRPTTQQTLLARADRLGNLRGAFRLGFRERRRPTIRRQPVALIDDVFTTGSTSEECARVLLQEGGAEKVVVLTVLRG